MYLWNDFFFQLNIEHAEVKIDLVGLNDKSLLNSDAEQTIDSLSCWLHTEYIPSVFAFDFEYENKICLAHHPKPAVQKSRS